MDFENIGGLVMPVLIGMLFEDGSTGVHRIPAEIWRRNSEQVQTLVVTSKEVVQFTLDPMLETADADVDNNLWPRQDLKPSRFDVFRAKQRAERANPMRSAQEQD